MHQIVSHELPISVLLSDTQIILSQIVNLKWGCTQTQTDNICLCVGKIQAHLYHLEAPPEFLDSISQLEFQLVMCCAEHLIRFLILPASTALAINHKEISHALWVNFCVYRLHLRAHTSVQTSKMRPPKQYHLKHQMAVKPLRDQLLQD